MPVRHVARFRASRGEVETAVGAALGRPARVAVSGRAAEPIEVEVAEDGSAVFTADLPPPIPWFQWFVGPANRLHARRALRWAAAAVDARLAGHDGPPAFRPSRFMPPTDFEPRQSGSIATAAAIGLVTGLGASLFSTNLDFIGKTFDASDRALGAAGAVTRIGVLLSLVLTAMADRRGRRRLLLISVAGLALSSAVSAAAPTLEVLTAAQLVNRGLFNAAFVVSAIVVVEEAPEGGRAYAIAMLALARGAGGAIATLLHPLADLGPDAWRIPFVIHAFTLLLIPGFARTLPETIRYTKLAARVVPTRLGNVNEVFTSAYRRRFLLILLVALLTNMFAAPSAQFANRYLEDQHGFSATQTTLFLAVTGGVPGFVGLMLGGLLSETRGRRGVAVPGLLAGSLATMGFFLAGGPALWVLGTVDLFVAGLVAPSLAAFGPELFPTEIRGTANAGVLVAGVIGSAVGLLVVGTLSDHTLSLGAAIAWTGIASIVVAVFVLPRLPEPAHQDLDTVSPPLV